MVEKESMLKDSIKKLGEMKGKRMVKFLDEAICYSTNPSEGTPCKTLEKYEESNVEYKGTVISSNDLDTFPLFSSIVQGYVSEILTEIDFYFPNVIARNTNRAKLDMSMFEPLNQKKWPTTDEEKRSYIPGSIRRLAKLLDRSLNTRAQNDLQVEFKNLVGQVLEKDAFFCKHSKDDPLVFWTNVVNNFKPSDRLKYFILAAALTPLSSADSERRYASFSM